MQLLHWHHRRKNKELRFKVGLLRESLKYAHVPASHFVDLINVFELHRLYFFHPLPFCPTGPRLLSSAVRLQSRGLPGIILAAGIPRPRHSEHRPRPLKRRERSPLRRNLRGSDGGHTPGECHRK